MSQGGDTYIQAGVSLSSAFGGTAGVAAINELAVKAVHFRAMAQEREMLMGQLSGSIESVRLVGVALAKHNQAMMQQANSKKKDTDIFALLDLYSDWLDDRIAAAEKGFEDKYGEDWREDMALKVLDEDEIPQRGDDESMAEYRERLEQALIDKMLDDEGHIKPEYLNHPDPEFRKLAEWARDKHDDRVKDEYVAKKNDSSLSATEQTQIDKDYIESSTGKRMIETQLDVIKGSSLDKKLSAAVDHEDDLKNNASIEITEAGF